MNELAYELSPYLLQHAQNPVHWKPWSSAAFELAEKENKPVFLSIGYATCHWCHVMERESFEDEAVAALLNANFVCIKVDREERPDIDTAYMEACMAMTGHGGWPLSLVLTPRRLPIFSGTYFPKHSRMGQIGFLDVMQRIAHIWANEHDRLNLSGEHIAKALQERTKEIRSDSEDEITREIVEKAASVFEATYDNQFGGFGSKPKFPTPHHYIFLLRLFSSNNNINLRNMALTSLSTMRSGGIYDQIGFGFHRYSTDERWFLPHFEKMLYDQAMLAIAYCEAFAVSGEQLYANVCKEIFEYVRRDMTSAEGAFYSAEDADSEGKEGAFYLWTWHDFDILPQSLAERSRSHFNLSNQGNYYDEATGKKTGENILYEHPHSSSLTLDEVRQVRTILLETRNKRTRPFLDDKILTDWNGMMIAALSYCGRLLKNNEYIERAAKAAKFLLSVMRNDDHLFHRFRKGKAEIRGFLDDYAFFAWGVFELYQASGEDFWLLQCTDICKDMISLFQDGDGSFRLAALGNNETPFEWNSSIFDSSIPSGASMAAYVLSRLGFLCDNAQFTDAAFRALQAYSGQMREYPAGFAWMMNTVNFLIGKRQKIILSNAGNTELYYDFCSFAQSQYLPNTVVFYDKNGEALTLPAPELEKMNCNATAAAYVCDELQCHAAVYSVAGLRTTLQESLQN